MAKRPKPKPTLWQHVQAAPKRYATAAVISTIWAILSYLPHVDITMTDMPYVIKITNEWRFPIYDVRPELRPTDLKYQNLTLKMNNSSLWTAPFQNISPQAYVTYSFDHYTSGFGSFEKGEVYFSLHYKIFWIIPWFPEHVRWVSFQRSDGQIVWERQ